MFPVRLLLQMRMLMLLLLLLLTSLLLFPFLPAAPAAAAGCLQEQGSHHAPQLRRRRIPHRRHRILTKPQRGRQQHLCQPLLLQQRCNGRELLCNEQAHAPLPAAAAVLGMHAGQEAQLRQAGGARGQGCQQGSDVEGQGVTHSLLRVLGKSLRGRQAGCGECRAGQGTEGRQGSDQAAGRGTLPLSLKQAE